MVLSIFFFIPFLFGAPYDPSREKALVNIEKLVNSKKGDRIAELGSGDGRVAIALAKKGVEIHGFEINPFLVWISRYRIRKMGLNKQIRIYWKNFWKKDLSGYNKVVFFQFSTIMGRLGRKFKKELKKGSIVVSHHWIIPGWKVNKKLGEHYLSYGPVYLYKV